MALGTRPVRKSSLIILGLTLFNSQVWAAKLTVFAAASLTDVLPRVAEAYKAENPNDSIQFNFDGSSRLAKEIEQGAPADIFFSADTEWMDYLAKANKITPPTRENVLHNEIVWVVPASAAKFPKEVGEIAKAPISKLALAGENVPISKYAKAALEKAGVWQAVENKIVRGENVRTSLKWAAEKEVTAAVVYRTDAQSNTKVKIAFVFPQNSYPEVVYPVAVVKTSAQAESAGKFVSFLKSSKAKTIFAAAGFK